MNRLETSEGIGNLISELFQHAGVSNRQVARMLNVNEKTIRNWLDGYSEPAPSDLIRLFRLLGVPMQPFFARRQIISTHEEHEKENDLTARLHYYIDNVASYSDKYCLELILSETSGSTSSVLKMFAMYLCCNLQCRLQICAQIIQNYTIKSEMGTLKQRIDDSWVDDVTKSMNYAKAAIINNRESYHNAIGGDTDG